MSRLNPVPHTPLRDNPTEDAIWKRYLEQLWIKTGAWVSGPSSSTDNAVARFNGTDGIVLQNSVVIIDDTGNVTGVVNLTATGQLALTTSGSSAGVLIGGDAQLYRSAADILRTPDSLTVDANLVVSGTASFSGTLTLSGSAANIATGSNFISNGGTDAGLSFDSSNNATLSAGLTVNGGAFVTGGSAPGVTITGIRAWQSSTTALLTFISTGGATDNKVWDIVTLSGAPTMRLVNDAINSATAFMSVARSGNTATSITFTCTNMTVSGDLAVNGGDITTASGNLNISPAGAVTTITGTAITTSSLSVNGTNALDQLTVHDTENNALAIQVLCNNVGAGSNAAGVGFQVASSGEYTTYGPKGGIVYERNAANGRGPLKLFNRATSDTAGFAAGDEGARLDNDRIFYAGMGVATSSQFSPVISKANVNTTAVGNIGIDEDNLITYTLPASAMNVAGRGVRIKAWGTVANTAALKTLRCYFGSTAMITNALATLAANVWVIEALVFSTGTDTQDYLASINLATTGATVPSVGTSTQDDGATITIKCTGAATNNNDIVQEGLLVEFLN